MEGKVYHCDPTTSESENEEGDRSKDSDTLSQTKSDLASDSLEKRNGFSENNSADEKSSSDGDRTPTEPVIGLLIDVDGAATRALSDHSGSDPGKREEADGVSPSPESSEGITPSGVSISGVVKNEEGNTSGQSNPSDNDEVTPEDSLASSDYNADSPVKGEVGYSPRREFNMSIDAYTPSLQGLEGASNPKLEGQSLKKPWQTWDSDSDDDFWNDNDEDVASQGRSTGESALYMRSTHKHSKPKSPPPKPVFNPFPRRKLKSEENRTRKGLKVGLYKMPAQGPGQSQQMDHPVQRMVKLGW